MVAKNVERLKVWRADAEWDDDIEVVKASDYDQLRAENERLKQELAARHQFRIDDPGSLVYGVDYGDADCPKPKPFFSLADGKSKPYKGACFVCGSSVGHGGLPCPYSLPS